MCIRDSLNPDNLVLIGLNCGGTLPPVKAMEMIQKLYETDPMDVAKEEISKGNFIIETKDHEHKELKVDDLEEMGYGRRANCRRCEEKIPRSMDLAFGNWGVIGPDAGKATFVEVCSEAGAQLLDDAVKAGALTTKDPIPKGIEIRENIEKAMLKLAAKWQAHDFLGPENRDEFWLEQFAKCIKCGGCWNACPVCVCDDCKRESCEPRWVESGILPPSPKLQYTRAAHMAADCVDCGQCEDACPVEIPLSTFFHQSTLTTKDPIPKGIEIRENIEKAMLKLAAKWQAHDFLGPENRDEFWLEQFAKCIKCGGCWNACPVCVCDDCKLESCEPRWVESGILPPSPKLQYTRAAHMAADCVDCGQCEDACPVEIPLSTFFHQSTKDQAKLFARFAELTTS